MQTVTELGRRVLGHLPVWAQDEKAFVKAEGGPDVSVRSYALEALVARLAEDPYIDPPLDEAQVADALAALEGEGLVSQTDGEWRMTREGFEAITAPVESLEPPGAVVIPVHPAQNNSKAGV